MRTIRMIAVGACLAALGCDDPAPTAPTKPVTTTAATSRPAATLSAKPPTTAGAPDKGKMANCPSAVTGAATAIKDTPEGVELTITAKDPLADHVVKEIRERAQHAAVAAKADVGKARHTGEGTGGGALGRCPVVLKNTTVVVADVSGGSKVTVSAADAKEVDWLRREAKERNADLATPGALEAGQGRMQHCPSAVEGAATEVKQTTDAVEVVVTAKDEAAVKDIRDRAKHIVEVAKLDPTDVKHTGDGKGGGGLGRCPVVLKDTTVEAKDVPGGSSFTVKPKKATDLAWLKTESDERKAKLSAAGAGMAGTAAPSAGSAAPAAGSAAPVAPKK